MTEEAREEASERTRARRVLPLNSHLLTASLVSRIVKGLGLPYLAPLDDVRQMVEGKLMELGEEPRNILVTLIESGEGVVIELRNEDGMFQTIEPELEPEREHEQDYEEDPERRTDDGGAGDAETTDGGSRPGSPEDSRVAQLKRELARLTEENIALPEGVSELRDGMGEAKQKYRNLWRMNCEQLGEYDVLVEETESACCRAGDT